MLVPPASVAVQLQVWFTPHAFPMLQTSPAQHGSAAPPQTPQVPPLQAKGDAHVSPPTLPAQHGWPSPPHARHVVVAPLQSVNGAVQSTPPPQHGWPALPHVPVMQPPPVQVP